VAGSPAEQKIKRYAVSGGSISGWEKGNLQRQVQRQMSGEKYFRDSFRQFPQNRTDLPQTARVSPPETSGFLLLPYDGSGLG